MKFKVLANQFLNTINRLNYIVPASSTLPILTNIKFDLKGNNLTLQATDLEIFMSHTLSVNGERDGELIAPAKELLSLIRALSYHSEISIRVPDLSPEVVPDALLNSTVFSEKFKCDFAKKTILLSGIMTEDEKRELIQLAGTDNLKSGLEDLFEKQSREFSKISFNVSVDEKKRMMLKTVNGRYVLACSASDDFPGPQETDEFRKIEFKDAPLARFLGKIIHTVSSNEIKRNMTGVLFDIRKNELRFVGTDGFRLGKYTKTNFKLKNQQEEKFIVPLRTCNLIIRINKTGKSVLEYSDKHIKVTINSTVLYSKLIDERFPNYESVIPKDNDKKLKISKKDLKLALNRALVFTDPITKKVKMEIKNTSLILRSDNPEKGGESEETIDCSFIAEGAQEADFDTTPFIISFNAQYLVECINQIDTEDMILTFSTPSKASIAYPTEQAEYENYMELVMPVRVI